MCWRRCRRRREARLNRHPAEAAVGPPECTWREGPQWVDSGCSRRGDRSRRCACRARTRRRQRIEAPQATLHHGAGDRPRRCACTRSRTPPAAPRGRADAAAPACRRAACAKLEGRYERRQETNAYAVLPETPWRGYRPPQDPPAPAPGTWCDHPAPGLRTRPWPRDGQAPIWARWCRSSPAIRATCWGRRSRGSARRWGWGRPQEPRILPDCTGFQESESGTNSHWRASVQTPANSRAASEPGACQRCAHPRFVLAGGKRLREGSRADGRSVRGGSAAPVEREQASACQYITTGGRLRNGRTRPASRPGPRLLWPSAQPAMSAACRLRASASASAPCWAARPTELMLERTSAPTACHTSGHTIECGSSPGSL